ncbi:MAG TPA: T9SS type A sorting domain-containing protein [Flavobacterium sp.]|nr:T9SS type A sorting domain-containing protein [Flavobacterium sp.]
MKKILLSIAVLGFIGTANAQKLALIEEFSGENCGPCASQNPGFMDLIETPGNEDKVLLLKYQSPIPTAGPIYYENTIFTDVRLSYYGVPSAPYGIVNGNHLVGENNPTAITNNQVGTVGYAQQSDIDNGAAEETNFTMSISDPVYDDNGQSFTATITVTATAATTESNTKLRVALAEELQYSTAPGTNGETHFQNVVRQMYPNAEGQAIDETWTAGQTRTYTITGAVPSYVNEDAPTVFLAAFLQDDSTLEVLQATRTDGNIDIEKSSIDIAATDLQMEVNSLVCDLPAIFDDVAVSVTNTATTEVTSFDVLYKFSNETEWNTEPWTGSLAAGSSVDVTLPELTLNNSGLVGLEIKVDNPNGNIDYNNYDNSLSTTFTVLNPEANDLPVTNDLEADLADWISYTTPNGYPIVRAESDGMGYEGSTYLLWYPCYQLPTGVAPGYYILPKANLAGESALDFYVAYAQYEYQGQVSGDRLEVVYSTDCGSTWTRIWMQEKSDLATAPNTSNPFRPTADQWQLRSVDLSDVPDDALIAFRATSGYGNDMFIDNITIRTGSAVSIDEVMDLNELKLFPNPTNDVLNVSLNMKTSESVNFTVINSIGQEVMNVNETLNEGNQQTSLNVSNLASGVYILNIHTEGGSTQRKFVKN